MTKKNKIEKEKGKDIDKLTYEKVAQLYKDFSLWKVDINTIKEQDKNARVMTRDKFEKLTSNIQQDRRLESLPLTILEETKSGGYLFKLVSGHHRVRAARKAGITELYILVIERDVSHSEMRSKQLSHNSLSGIDDPQTLKELYFEIDDINFKIASGITDQELELDGFNVNIDDIKVDLDYENISILFLPKQTEMLEKVFDDIMLENGTKVFLADKKDFKKFHKLVLEISKLDNIHNISAIFARMLELTRERLNDLEEVAKKVRVKDKEKDKKIKSK